jgi:hypothetical protein
MMLALDRAIVSTRQFDEDGRLRVSAARISSKAQVRRYRGVEIADCENLDLDEKRIYRMLWPPDELERSAASFCGLPLLSKHVPLSAGNHPPELIVGTTGSDAQFVDPYLHCTLTIWTQQAIDAIVSGSRRELSCSYHYDPEMTPGSFRGDHFDGVMRNIRGYHVAIVEKGRAGHDVAIDHFVRSNRRQVRNGGQYEHRISAR